MHYIYIINSISLPDKFYVGYSLDVQARLKDHNSERSVHTKKDLPWKLFFYCAFENQLTALAFEKYLKSHSGRSFAKKHFATIS